MQYFHFNYNDISIFLQNVLKQIGLNVLSCDGRVIQQLRSFILRCYACFKTTSIMTKVFCPNCGNRTLKKVAVSLKEDGTQVIHISSRKRLTARGKRVIQYYNSYKQILLLLFSFLWDRVVNPVLYFRLYFHNIHIFPFHVRFDLANNRIFYFFCICFDGVVIAAQCTATF